MKPAVRWSAVILGLGAALALAIFLIAPPETDADPCYRCIAAGKIKTMGWGQGSTCAAAEAAAVADARNSAGCSTCSESYVITAPCYPVGGGQFQVDLELSHGCFENICA